MLIINRNLTSHHNIRMNRFDFGVPLEDISPPNDIHPRLKHLFHQALKHYNAIDADVEYTLKGFQGSLEDRFNLKDELVFQVPCNISDHESPGSYFWLIRHFLGLLPIPLLPKYHKKFTYDWEGLGKKCEMVLSHKKYDINLKYKVIECIARFLDTLPAEHFLLLTTLVSFIRKIAFRFGVLHKRNFICLSKYYCGSVLVRPYRPGHKDDKKLFPLFMYLLANWNNISRKCGRQIIIPEMNRELKSRYQLMRNAYSQADFLNPNYNNIVQNSMNKLSIACYQNDVSSNISKQYSCTHKSCQTELTETVDTHCQTNLMDFDDSECIVPIANSSVIDNHYSEKYYTALCNETNFYPDTYIHSVIDNDERSVEKDSLIDFSSTIESNNHMRWDDIMRETEITVKKVEEYIYDDYETFRWEDYNQISTEKMNMSTFKKQLEQPVWTDCTPKSLIYMGSNDKIESISAMISNKTYYKFPDLISDDFTEFSCSLHSTAPTTSRENQSMKVSKSCNHLNEHLCNSEKPEEVLHKKSKINFSLKRFKMSFDFLRDFIPRRNYRTTYQDLASNVRYKKICNGKASTL